MGHHHHVSSVGSVAGIGLPQAGGDDGSPDASATALERFMSQPTAMERLAGAAGSANGRDYEAHSPSLGHQLTHDGAAYGQAASAVSRVTGAGNPTVVGAAVAAGYDLTHEKPGEGIGTLVGAGVGLYAGPAIGTAAAGAIAAGATALGGAEAGAALGSVVPGIGTAIGFVAGAAIGYAASKLGAKFDSPPENVAKKQIRNDVKKEANKAEQKGFNQGQQIAREAAERGEYGLYTQPARDPHQLDAASQKLVDAFAKHELDVLDGKGGTSHKHGKHKSSHQAANPADPKVQAYRAALETHDAVKIEAAVKAYEGYQSGARMSDRLRAIDVINRANQLAPSDFPAGGNGLGDKVKSIVNDASRLELPGKKRVDEKEYRDLGNAALNLIVQRSGEAGRINGYNSEMSRLMAGRASS